MIRAYSTITSQRLGYYEHYPAIIIILNPLSRWCAAESKCKPAPGRAPPLGNPGSQRAPRDIAAVGSDRGSSVSQSINHHRSFWWESSSFAHICHDSHLAMAPHSCLAKAWALSYHLSKRQQTKILCELFRMRDLIFSLQSLGSMA